MRTAAGERGELTTLPGGRNSEAPTARTLSTPLPHSHASSIYFDFSFTAGANKYNLQLRAQINVRCTPFVSIWVFRMSCSLCLLSVLSPGFSFCYRFHTIAVCLWLCKLAGNSELNRDASRDVAVLTRAKKRIHRGSPHWCFTGCTVVCLVACVLEHAHVCELQHS